MRDRTIDVTNLETRYIPRAETNVSDERKKVSFREVKAFAGLSGFILGTAAVLGLAVRVFYWVSGL